MAADDYAQVAGKFKAMQWTGSNTAAFQAWVQGFTSLAAFTADNWTTDFSDYFDANRMTLYWLGADGFSVLTMAVPEGGWAVFGPYWGTDPTLYWRPGPRTPWQQFTDAQFNREYAAAP